LKSVGLPPLTLTAFSATVPSTHEIPLKHSEEQIVYKIEYWTTSLTSGLNGSQIGIG